MSERWLEVWTRNYNNESAIAKNVMALSKTTYKGDTYLPWALMVGALYQLDPEAVIEKVQNFNDGYVITDTLSLKTIKDGVETLSTVTSHMVKVKVKFMGKHFEDAYPIQDNDYSPSKVYDQNKVNKAQQRCLARIISMATGIGWRIYEQTEAQFEDDKKPEITKPIVKTVEVETVLTTDSKDTPSVELAKLIVDNKDKPALATLLGNYNEVLKKKYVDDKGEPITLGIDDSLDVLVAKIGFLDNPDKMIKGIRKAVGA